MKTLAKWPWCHYISEMTNSKTDIMKHESISDWLFQPYKRLRLCVCLCALHVCVCFYWMTGLLLAECIFNIQCVSTRCKAMQTALSIPLRLSLMSLTGWSRHTPGSLGLSQEPEGRQHNVFTMDGAQMCPRLYLKKPTPKYTKSLRHWRNGRYFGKRQELDEKINTSLSHLSTEYEAATSS